MEAAFTDSQLLPAPKSRWHRFTEAFETGSWLMIATVLIGSLVLTTFLELQQREILRLQQAKLKITLYDLRARLETDLSLGLDLDDNSKAQALLEEAIATDASIRTFDIYNAEGVTLFSTDRGTIGEQAARSLFAEISRQKSRKEALSVDLQVGDDTIIALPLSGSFKETAGYLSVSFGAARPKAFSSTVAFGGLMIFAIALGALVFNAWAIRPQLDIANNTSGATVEAVAARARLIATRERLDATWDAMQEELGTQKADDFTDSKQSPNTVTKYPS